MRGQFIVLSLFLAIGSSFVFSASPPVSSSSLSSAPSTSTSSECFESNDGYSGTGLDKLEESVLRQAVVNYTVGDEEARKFTVAKYGIIEDWCVDYVTDMDKIFWDSMGKFNESIADLNLSKWNVSGVTSMYGMVRSMFPSLRILLIDSIGCSIVR